eukprot:Lankesteria_metandrocarpae@DN677_c0_g1_i1.p1
MILQFSAMLEKATQMFYTELSAVSLAPQHSSAAKLLCRLNFNHTFSTPYATTGGTIHSTDNVDTGDGGKEEVRVQGDRDDVHSTSSNKTGREKHSDTVNGSSAKPAAKMGSASEKYVNPTATTAAATTAAATTTTAATTTAASTTTAATNTDTNTVADAATPATVPVNRLSTNVPLSMRLRALSHHAATAAHQADEV